MGDSSNVSVEKKKGFKALKAEYKKIMWPSKETVFRKSVAVIAASAILSILIAIIDYVVGLGLGILL